MSDVVLVEVADRVATVTLNRPEARNALNRDLRRAIPQAINELEADDGVDVIILTGADPAFCAGLDLKELGSGEHDITRSVGDERSRQGPMPAHTKPIIGAVNGVAITGGFELALNCDLLIASDRARFADTHARVGVQPGWGLTVLLPQAIGVRRAREMSFTGNFMAAEEALQFGLVNHVVAHEDLLPFTRSIATDIIGNDQPGVRQIRATYAAIAHDDDGWEQEARDSRMWQRTMFSPEKVAERRAAIQARGKAQ